MPVTSVKASLPDLSRHSPMYASIDFLVVHIRRPNFMASSAGDDDASIDFEDLNADKVARIGRQLDAASRCGVGTLRHRLAADKIDALFKRATKLLKSEPTVVDIALSDPEATVTIVGDTHGQLHDVLHMFEVAGSPGEGSTMVLNGDFVDRGSWGLETLIWLVCWKLTYPTTVYLVRGNHESQLMTQLYGFKAEVEAKYSRVQNRTIYAASKKLFAAMPLAVVIQEATLVCHGGLFRSTGRKRKKGKQELQLGTLAMLRGCAKGGLEPTGPKVAQAVSDVLWSDPAQEKGLSRNDSRGLGLVFGPDMTDAFLEANHLKLIIRSHEGPDARQCREDMLDMMDGFAVDHETPHGKLITVFSAPDYPQHQDGGTRTNNKAAVVILSAPDYATPRPVQFEAVLPRPYAPVFYDMESYAETDVDFNEVYESSESPPEAEPSASNEDEIDQKDPVWIPSSDSDPGLH